MTTCVLDANAGRGPEEALRAAALASLDADLDVDLVVVGDEEKIAKHLGDIAHDAERLRVVHAPDAIDRSLSASTIASNSPNNAVSVGLRVACELGAPFISAGHPGFILHAARTILTRTAGADAAALAAVIPTTSLRGERNDPFALLLDIGACPEPSADVLVQFALMGAIYAARVADNAAPKVALLANATHADELPASRQAAHRALSALTTDEFVYAGLIRAEHMMTGGADVIVTDGFSGDVVVRTLEGIATTADDLLKQAQKRFRWRVGVSMLSSGLTRLRELADWENYGGAPLLGFEIPVIVTQSSSHHRALLNAIRLARKVTNKQVVPGIATALARLGSLGHGSTGDLS